MKDDDDEDDYDDNDDDDNDDDDGDDEDGSEALCKGGNLLKETNLGRMSHFQEHKFSPGPIFTHFLKLKFSPAAFSGTLIFIQPTLRAVIMEVFG